MPKLATFELPGLRMEDMHNGWLGISEESKISEEHEENGYAVREEIRQVLENAAIAMLRI